MGVATPLVLWTKKRWKAVINGPPAAAGATPAGGGFGVRSGFSPCLSPPRPPFFFAPRRLSGARLVACQGLSTKMKEAKEAKMQEVAASELAPVRGHSNSFEYGDGQSALMFR